MTCRAWCGSPCAWDWWRRKTDRPDDGHQSARRQGRRGCFHSTETTPPAIFRSTPEAFGGRSATAVRSCPAMSAVTSWLVAPFCPKTDRDRTNFALMVVPVFVAAGFRSTVRRGRGGERPREIDLPADAREMPAPMAGAQRTRQVQAGASPTSLGEIECHVLTLVDS